MGKKSRGPEYELFPRGSLDNPKRPKGKGLFDSLTESMNLKGF
jgi:hypothetical protein